MEDGTADQMEAQINVARSMTTSQIISLHADGNAAKLSEMACVEMGMSAMASHTRYYFREPDRSVCVMCPGAHPYCTRFATDLTSAAEFEKKCMPKGYIRKVFMHTNGARTEVWKEDPTFQTVPPTQTFSSENEALNRCAATLYAIAWERESNGTT